MCDESPPPPLPPGMSKSAMARAAAPRGAACSSLAVDDLPFESCEQPTCGVASSEEQCSTCRCKACASCGGTIGLPNQAAKGGGGHQACVSRWKDDVSVAVCEDFCSEAQATIHCSLCKCASCEWCAGHPQPSESTAGVTPMNEPRVACHSIIKGDLDFEGCSFLCAREFAPVMCLMCKCAACDFCQAVGGGAASGGGALALSHPPAPPACSSQAIGHNRRWDIDHEDCQSYCDPKAAAIHCKQCKCIACSWCPKHAAEPAAAVPLVMLPAGEGTRTSGVQHTHHSYGDEAGDDDSADELEISSPGPPCSSAVLSDARTAQCARWCGDSRPMGGDAFAPQVAAPAGALAGACSMCWCRGCGMCISGPGVVGNPAPALLAPLGEPRMHLVTCALGGQVLLTRIEGSEFEAIVILGGWAPHATLNVTFTGQKKVTVDSIRGATVVGGPLPVSSYLLGLSFVLDGSPPASRNAPPNSFTFGAHVRYGFSYDPQQPPPSFACDVSLHPSPPAPPPQPRPPPPYPSPPPPPPLPAPPAPPPWNTCPLGLAFILDLQWLGGFRASVLVGSWAPGELIRIDFRGSGGDYSMATVKNAKLGAHCSMHHKSEMACEFVLGTEPDNKGAFSFVARGGGGTIHPPLLSCGTAAASKRARHDGHAPGAAADEATAYPPLPPIASHTQQEVLALDRCALGPIVTVKNTWAAGYRAAVRLVHWVPHATLTLRVGAPKPATASTAGRLELLNTYAATVSKPAPADGTVTFHLAAAADEAYGGFGFTARGVPPPLDDLDFRCPNVTAAMVVSPPPPPDCVLGASFEYLDSWGVGFEAEVRVRSWRGGARFHLDFDGLGWPPLEVLNTWHAVLEKPPRERAHAGGGGAPHGAAAARASGGHASHASSKGSEAISTARELSQGAPTVASAIDVTLVPEPKGSPYESFKLVARFAPDTSDVRAPSALPAAPLALPVLSCTVAHAPPPPTPRTTELSGATSKGAFVPPDAPEQPRVLRASCASIEVGWEAPDDRGWSIEEYRVLAGRPGVDPEVVAHGLKATRAELTGMLTSTTYAISVQARGPAGWSASSEAVYGSTEPALRQPATPYGAPKPAATGAAAAQLRVAASPNVGSGTSAIRPDAPSGACANGVALNLPALRGGCSGDEWYTLEVQRATEPGVWRSATQRFVSENVAVDGFGGAIDARTAFYTRLVAHNSAGSSSAGPRSELLISNHGLSPAVMAPLVEATSSFSILIRPPHGSAGAHGHAAGATPPPLGCDVARGLHYEVLLRHEGADEWQTLMQVGEGGQQLPIEVGSTACRGGCYLKLRALNVSGWDGRYSHASSRVVTPPPPAAIPTDGARVELRLKAPLPLGSPRMAAASRLLRDLTDATGLPPSQLTLAELSSSGLFVAIDVLSPAAASAAAWGGGGHGAASEDVSEGTVSDALSRLVASRAALEPLPLDLRFGVRRQIVAEGVAPTDPHAMFSDQLLEGASGGGSLRAGRAASRQLTLLLITMILLGACCLPALNLGVGQAQRAYLEWREAQAAAREAEAPRKATAPLLAAGHRRDGSRNGISVRGGANEEEEDDDDDELFGKVRGSTDEAPSTRLGRGHRVIPTSHSLALDL